MSTVYVTTPIYYVNDLPHIGHIYTTVVADVMARYHRLAGDEVRFLTGTDEHGQKIERAARDQGVEPIALADRVVERYHELWEQLGISHDDFVRTTQARHRAGVEALIERIEASGDLYRDRHEGWYCTGCELFYTEKELAEAADGPEAAEEHRCPVHETPCEWKSEENVFFRLSRYQEPLLEWYRDHPEAVRPESRLNEVRSFVESGLKDLSVSRANLAWGIPFPDVPGQTIYVWLDALTNYVSALGFGAEAEEGGGDADGPSPYERFWTGGEHRIHLVGKDILRFHAVYWPAFLLSAGLPLPTTVWAHGWWLRDSKKVSKSSANVVRPDHLIERFGADPLRYFLLREMVFGQDASFSDEGFIERYNADFANDLGNTVSRVVTLARRAFDGRTPLRPEAESPLAAVAREVVAEYRQAMDERAFQNALASLWRLLSETNGYLVDHAPWKAMKDGDEGLARAGEVLWNGLEAVRVVAVGLLPFMPAVAPRVLAAVASPEVPESLDALAWGATPGDAPLPETDALFPRIDKEAYVDEIETDRDETQTTETKPTETKPAGDGPAAGTAEKPAKPAKKKKAGPEPAEEISIGQFFATDLRVATVTAAEPIPKSNKLLKLTVDLGEETRTVVAGLARAYEAEDLVGTQVVVVANLAPAKLMGVESQGMVLAASVDGQPVVLRPGAAVEPGTKVT